MEDRPSLAGRAAEALRNAGAITDRWPTISIGSTRWPVALTIAALLAAGPVLTIAGAKLIEARVREEAAVLARRAAPRIDAEQRMAAAHVMLREAVRAPALGGTMERLARVLPRDAALVRAERDAVGVIEIEVATADPDRLRAALRRDPAFASLRAVAQRRGDAAMLVTLRADR